MDRQPFRWVVLFGCWLLYFVFGLSVTSLAPLVSTIIEDLQITASAMGAVLGAWQFVYIFCAIPVGLALHRFGPGRMLILGTAIIAASGFLRSFSGAQPTLLAAVALFGLGGPIISAGVPQTIAKWFSGKERGLAMGVYITGPALAGVVTYSSTHGILMPWLDGNWRNVLQVWAWAAVAAGLIWLMIWLLSRKLVPESKGSAGIGQAPSANVLGEIREILSSTPVVILLVTGIGTFTLDHGLRNWTPEIIRTAGWSVEQAGYLAVIPVVMGIIGALIFPRLATPARRANIMRSLFAMAGTGCVLLSTGRPAAMVAGLVCIGLASGAMMTTTLLALIEQGAVGPQRAGLAGGLYFSVAEIGGVGGPVMIGILRDTTGGFDIALWLLGAIAVILIALSFLSQRRTGRT